MAHVSNGNKSYRQPELNGNYRQDRAGQFHHASIPPSARSRHVVDDSSDESCSSVCGSQGDGSDSNSASEEEKMRRLFQSCDTDGDGYIDRHDLMVVCRELNMEDSVHEIMQQLGGDENGRISLGEFLQCQHKLKGEIHSLALQHTFPDQEEDPLAKLEQIGHNDNEQNFEHNKLTSWPTSSDNSLASSAARESSWEKDSGARDLSPEPGAFLQKLIEGTSSPRGASNFLELANTLHLAALASLKGEIIELTNSLQRATAERDASEKKLAKAQMERAKLQRETEDRLDQQAVRYEERITELHSVIAELNKKIDRTQPNDVIREEDEFSQSASSPPSNISNSGGSCNGSCFHGSESANIDQCNDISSELQRVVDDLEVSIEVRKNNYRTHIEDANNSIEQHTSASELVEQRAFEACKEIESLHFDSTLTDHSTTATPNGTSHHGNQLRRRNSLEQEVGLLREENDSLNTNLRTKEEELQKIKGNFITIRDERDKLRRKVREIMVQHQKQNQNTHSSTNSNIGNAQKSTYNTSSSSEQLSSPSYRPSAFPGLHSINPSTGEVSQPNSERRSEAPVAKVAERVKLKPSRSDSSKSSGERPVYGSELSNSVTNPKVAEHLAQSLQDCSSMQEILQTLNSHGLSIPESKAREFEVEMERLNSKIEHLKSQNDLLQLSLEESKSNADRLTMLVGKYESNNTALQLAVNYSDQTIEAYEVLHGLSDSEQQLILANCKAVGVGGLGMGESSEGSGEDSEEASQVLKRVHDNRKSSENLAKSLLQRLDRSCGTMVCHVPGCTLQPWEDVSSHSHTSTTSSTASSCDTEFSKEDEQRLRDYILQLKNDRAAVRLTVMELESVHIDSLSNEKMPSMDNQKLDLENAVLMQELTAMKEEKAELKAQYYLLEKEKKALELKLSSREAQEKAYLVQIDHLKSEVREQQWADMNGSKGKDLSKFSKEYNQNLQSNTATPAITLAELSHLEDPNIPVDLAEMIRREKRLKSRIQELVATLEKLQKNSELRHQQSAEFVADLKRANSALVTAYEKAKKKHQSRLKKLEAQMIAMVERHDTQVRMLKQRIALLEEENHSARPTHNETSL
ncbi:colorectal mutant cancer protein-like isoform X2 [Amphiura filiformis]|uniref:colorectal mutant cancer protein-like isoform X2 n=1 Tax=Amphiura filiformis TaxID=82378 RepID=UPI003B21F849